MAASAESERFQRKLDDREVEHARARQALEADLGSAAQEETFIVSLVVVPLILIDIFSLSYLYAGLSVYGSLAVRLNGSR